MAARDAVETKAERWGRRWGSRAEAWAATEEQQLPTYEAAIERLAIGAGHRVLEVGCGSGVFLRAAADRGAEVSGVDSSERLVALARERVPEADVRVGDLQEDGGPAAQHQRAVARVPLECRSAIHRLTLSPERAQTSGAWRGDRSVAHADDKNRGSCCRNDGGSGAPARRG